MGSIDEPNAAVGSDLCCMESNNGLADNSQFNVEEISLNDVVDAELQLLDMNDFTPSDPATTPHVRATHQEFDVPVEGIVDSELQHIDMNDVTRSDGIMKGSDREKPKCRRCFTFCAMIALVAVMIFLKVLNLTENFLWKKSSDPNNETTGHHPNHPAFFSCAPAALQCPAKNVTSDTSISEWVRTKSFDGEAENDFSGHAVAVSCDGSIVAISAPYNENRKGHVRVYQLQDSGHWVQLGIDIEGVAIFDQFGASLSLSASGLRVAVGSRWNDGRAHNAGHTQVFDYVNGLWIQVGQEIEGEAENDQSGRSVALSADGLRLAIGSSNNNSTGMGAGHARVFEVREAEEHWIGIWYQVGESLDGEFAGDQFGRAVALSGNGLRVAVGGHLNDGVGGADTGHVRVFDLDEKTEQWKQIGDDIEGPWAGDLFGSSLAMTYDGKRLAVGAPGDTANSITGVSMVFELYGTKKWKQMGTNLEGGKTVSLSLDGTRIVTGSHRGSRNGPNSGQAIVYDYNGTDWTQVGSDVVGSWGDMSGSSVAISADGNRFVSAAPSSDTNGTTNLGRVRVYEYC